MKTNLTKTAVDSFENPPSGQVLYYDAKLTGFGVWLTPKAKTFFVEAKVNGKTVRTKIGRYGVFTVDQARDTAKQLLARMASGENINDTKRERKAAAEVDKLAGITLRTAFDEYVQQRTSGQGATLKEKTITGYRWMIDHVFPDWKEKPVANITESMVRERHAKVTKDAGPYEANGGFRVLRMVLGYTREANKRPDGSYALPSNPVDVLTRLKIWNAEKRNKRFVKSDQLGAWFDAVLDIDETRFRHGEATRTLLLVMIFLGFRSHEARSILLSEVDIEGSSLRLLDTKNGDEHFVPVGPFLLSHIKATAEASRKARSRYLFCSKESATGYLHDIRKVLKDVCDTAKVTFSPHDLRRTFVSMLDSMEPAPSHYMIKRLMNHRAKPSDVTAGYIQHEEKKLLSTVTQLEAWILGCAGRQVDGSPSVPPSKKQALPSTPVPNQEHLSFDSTEAACAG